MSDARSPQAVVIGAGPAGLMAAEMLARAGLSVLVAEAKTSPARKFLMAGKSGLNLTMDVGPDQLLAAYGDRAPWLAPMIRAFDAQAVQDWARGLGQDLFTGSTGRVFPTVMKGSPLLRQWLAVLDQLGVQRRSNWRWQGWEDGRQGGALQFQTPTGLMRLSPRVTVLALGGASWARLGSDGAWTARLAERGVALAPFRPANAALRLNWSAHMAPHFGTAIKAVEWRAGDLRSRGEATLSRQGLEGGGLYPLSPALREGLALEVDLCPDLDPATLTARLARPRGKTSLSNHLRRQLRLAPAKTALLQEFCRPLPTDPAALARVIKALVVEGAVLAPLDEAISTAGGVCQSALDPGLMLRVAPGVFCAGEMLDWEAPTGGYLITGCLATGRWAGAAAARYLLGTGPGRAA